MKVNLIFLKMTLENVTQFKVQIPVRVTHFMWNMFATWRTC